MGNINKVCSAGTEEEAGPTLKVRAVGVCGVDTNTDLDKVEVLLDSYPFLEFGVLLRQDKAGQARYPSEEVLQKIFKLGQSRKASGKHWRFCAHLCQKDCQNVIDGADEGVALLDKLVRAGFKRVQLNPTLNNGVRVNQQKWPEIRENLTGLFKKYAGALTFILQRNHETKYLLDPLLKSADRPANVTYLQDESKGLGIKPQKRIAPAHDIPIVGYAGGMNPENVVAELGKAIAAIETCENVKAIWIDMESGLRTKGDGRGEPDVFDLAKVEAVAIAVQAAAWPKNQAANFGLSSA